MHIFTIMFCSLRLGQMPNFLGVKIKKNIETQQFWTVFFRVTRLVTKIKKKQVFETQQLCTVLVTKKVFNHHLFADSISPRQSPVRWKGSSSNHGFPYGINGVTNISSSKMIFETSSSKVQQKWLNNKHLQQKPTHGTPWDPWEWYKFGLPPSQDAIVTKWRFSLGFPSLKMEWSWLWLAYWVGGSFLV